MSLLTFTKNPIKGFNPVGVHLILNHVARLSSKPFDPTEIEGKCSKPECSTLPYIDSQVMSNLPILCLKLANSDNFSSSQMHTPNEYRRRKILFI